jgi:hypothetical protein
MAESLNIRYTAFPFLFTGYERNIGVATLPEQIHRQLVKRKYDFTLMVKLNSRKHIHEK